MGIIAITIIFLFFICLVSALFVSALPDESADIEKWLQDYDKKKRQEEGDRFNE